MFKTKIEFETYLQKLIERQPRRLSIVFRGYGVPPTEEITPGLFLAVHRAKGDKLYRDLATYDAISNFEGDENDTDTAPTFWEKVKNTVNDSLEILKSASEIKSNLDNGGSSGSNNNSGDGDKEDKKDTILGIPKFFFWGGVTLLTLLTLYIIIKSIKK